MVHASSLRQTSSRSPATSPHTHPHAHPQATPVAAAPTLVVYAPAIAQSRPRYFGTNLSNTNVVGPALSTSQDKSVAAAPAHPASSSSPLPLPQDSVTPTVSPNASLAAAAVARFVAAANAQHALEPLPRKQRRKGLQQHPRNPTRKQLRPCPSPTEPRPRDPPSHYLCGGPAPEQDDDDDFVDAYEDFFEDEDEDEEVYEDAYDEPYQDEDPTTHSETPVRNFHFACGGPSCEDVSPPKDNPDVPEGDDLVYPERGVREPPKWNSGKAVPIKSSLSKKHRYHPYARPSVPWSYTTVKAELAEALLNRHDQNYEGPNATAIHDEMSRIDVPGTGPSFKWEPAYTGPPNAFPEELEEVESSPPISFVGSEGFIRDDELRKDEVAEMRVPTNSKKRRLEDEDTDNVPSPQGSPVKKLRRALQQIQKQNPGFATDVPSPNFTFTPPSLPTSTSQPSSLSALKSTTSSNTDATRKAVRDRRKTRVSFKADSSTLHPKHGVMDSLHLHYSRLPSKSLHQSKAKKTVHRSGPDWYSKELEKGRALKTRWTTERVEKFNKLTCFAQIEERIKLQGDHDGKWECWGDAVDRYEAAYPAIDLAGVRAKSLRPAEKEVRGILNKEATSPVGESEPMRKWYPKWEHPAWDGVDEEAKRAWRRSPHYQVTHREVKRALGIEASRRSDRRMEMEMAARMEGGGDGDGDTEVDETEDAMRREFLEEGQTGEVAGQAPALQAPPPLEPIHPGLEMSAEAEARWESRWSAPNALPPTRLPV